MKNDKKGNKLVVRTTTRLKMRQVYVAAFAFLLVAGGIFLAINLSNNTETKGAALGDYRSAGNGLWGTPATWEMYNGASWIAAVTVPSNASGAITILAGDTVTVTADATADQFVIEPTGGLLVNTGLFTLSNGAGLDLQMDGYLVVTSRINYANTSTSIIGGLEILRSAGIISMGSASKRTIVSGGVFQREGGSFTTNQVGTLTVSSGGIFRHAMNGGAVPSGTWSSGSSCEITGITNVVPTNITQSFYSLTWNCSSQTAGINLDGTLNTITGDFIFQNTGTGYVVLDQQGNNSILNIGRNLVIIGGTLYGCLNGSASINVAGDYLQSNGTLALSKSGGTAYGNSSTAVNVTGNTEISGGTLDMSQCSSSNPSKGIGLLYVKRNVTFSGSALITSTSSMSHGQVHFNGTIEQLYSSQDVNVIGKVDFVIDPLAILRLDQQIIKSDGTFLIDNTGGMLIGNPNGITATSASGNVQVTGTRTYSAGADYTYMGVTSQSTGDGLPVVARNITFNNTNLVTLSSSSSASGTLTLNGGLIVTNSNYLGMGSSATVLGTLNKISGYVNGNFRRWFAAAMVSNVLFPIGTAANYNPIAFSFTTAPIGGTITAFFMPSESRLEGLPLVDAGSTITTSSDCYWSATAGNGFSGGVFNVNVTGNGMTGVVDYTQLHLLRRPVTASNWAVNGTHVAATGSNTAPVVNRTGMTLLGQYGFGSSNANPLPIELLYFHAKRDGNNVELTWSTSAEKDNDYFTVERSVDGRIFTPILKQPGAGNSKVVLTYKAYDEHPMSVNYYRLKQTDFDGKFSYSSIAMVRFDKTTSDSKLKFESIGPNPFNENFKLQFSSDEESEVDIIIVNLTGQTIHREKRALIAGMNTYEFYDIYGLKPGTYIVTLLTKDEKLTQKVIKN